MALRAVRGHLPPHLFDALQRLCATGRSFIEQYELKDERMRAIAKELEEISKDVKQVQEDLSRIRRLGIVLGGLGIAGIVLLLRGGSLGGDRAEDMAALGFTAACAGGSVITANVMKTMEEKKGIETVEKLGNEFVAIVEQFKGVLEEVKELSGELVGIDSILEITSGAQADRSLSETEQLQQLFEQIARLAERSNGGLDVTRVAQRGVRELLNFVINVGLIGPTPEEDAEFRNCITNSAMQCKQTVNELANMKTSLEDLLSSASTIGLCNIQAVT